MGVQISWLFWSTTFSAIVYKNSAAFQKK
jgi:hypothetical protein